MVDVEETLKRIQGQKNVAGVIIMDSSGLLTAFYLCRGSFSSKPVISLLCFTDRTLLSTSCFTSMTVRRYWRQYFDSVHYPSCFI